MDYKGDDLNWTCGRCGGPYNLDDLGLSLKYVGCSALCRHSLQEFGYLNKTTNLPADGATPLRSEEKGDSVSIMATNNWTVYVPDRSQSYPFPKSMEIEEVRASLIATGNSSVSSATYTVDGDVVRFNRVQGGSKGL